MTKKTRKPKVFILGISSFLGYQLALKLRPNFLISGIYFKHQVNPPDAQVYPVNLKNIEIIETIVRIQAPDITINAIGLNDRKILLEQEKLGENLNTLIPVSFGVLANKIKAKHLHLSCADVYDGESGNYSEDSTEFTLNDPLGKQKITAESYIRSQTLESTTLRVGKVMGIGLPFRQNDFDLGRGTLEKKSPLSAAKNQTLSYLSTHSFTNAVEQILLNEIPARHRIFNLGGPTLTPYDFWNSWAKLLGFDDKYIKQDTNADEKNLTMKSDQFAKAYGNWKPETKEQLFLNILRELSPRLPPKKWQKILQIP
jgi:dTDP-4-dehydrorhamnose reductase